MLIIEEDIHEIKIAIHANSIGLFNFSINYHAKEQLIIITLKQVNINIGYDFPNPCITLPPIIPIHIKGTANAKILK